MPCMGCLEWMIRTAAAVETDEIEHLPKVNWYYVKMQCLLRGKSRTHYPNFTGDISLYSFQSLYILPYFFYLLINDAKYLMSYYTATTLVLKSSIWGNAKLSTLALCQNSSPAGRWSLNYIFFIRERFDGKFWQIVIFFADMERRQHISRSPDEESTKRKRKTSTGIFFNLVPIF